MKAADWLRAAFSDDYLVAELLLRLNPPDSRRLKLPPLDWGMRLPRSKAAAPSKKELDASRRSPTTPLSWTTTAAATASPSDSCEESSPPLDRLVSAARFKGNATNDTTNSVRSVSGSRRPRKKKTFAELKEVESSLMKERKHLNEELESLRVKFEEQRSSNEKLKRIKLDLHAQFVPKPLPNVNQHGSKGQFERVESEEFSTNLCPVPNESSNDRPVFELPDLNMMPEEDLNTVEVS